MPRTTVAVVTALSPSDTTLAEYGLHFLTSLGSKASIKVVGLVEDRDLDYPHIHRVELRRTWRFGAWNTPFKIARSARNAGADIVIINAHFRSFGSTRASAALGLLTPLIIRLYGVRVITLLHNIVETVDLSAAGFKANGFGGKFLRLVGTVLTWCVLQSNLVTTTMPRYVEILRAKYRATNVALTPHGAFGVAAEHVEVLRNENVIMTFGKFGTYKKVEVLIDAVRRLKRPDIRLVIAGTDSPNTPGYLDSVKRELGGDDVEFLGYVPESDVERVFREATITVFPYTATTGSSGVLHQAGAFGCPPVLPRLGDLEDLLRDEGYTGEFFEPDDVDALARAVKRLLDNPDDRRRIASTNRAAALGLSLDEVADWYLVHIGQVVYHDPLALFR